MNFYDMINYLIDDFYDLFHVELVLLETVLLLATRKMSLPYFIIHRKKV